MLVLSPRSYSLTPTTRADPVTQGKTYHLTRRCDRRLRRLTPDSKVTSIVKFALFHAAKECGIEVHAACFSTNHFHLVITDPNGRHPDFMQRMNSMIARALNAQHGVKGHFWGPGSYEKVELIGFDALLRTLVYVTLNPVKDGLVSSPKAYPGFLTRPDQVGCTFRAHKPATASSAATAAAATRPPSPRTPPSRRRRADPDHAAHAPPARGHGLRRLPPGLSGRRRRQARGDPRRAEGASVPRRPPDPHRGSPCPRPRRPSPTALAASGPRRSRHARGVRARREERTAWRRDYVQARDSWPRGPAGRPPAGLPWLLGQRYGALVLAHPSA
ncbi:MAG: transposase [Planctomycetota bacterium]